MSSGFDCRESFLSASEVSPLCTDARGDGRRRESPAACWPPAQGCCRASRDEAGEDGRDGASQAGGTSSTLPFSVASFSRDAEC